MEISAEKALKMGAGIMETFKGNPLMSTLVGMGVGWLIATERGGSHKADILKEKIAELLESKDVKAGKKAASYAEDVRDYARDFGAQAESWAREFGTLAQKQYQRACAGVKEMAEEKPVVLAAASVAIAAILGVGIWQILREKE